MMIADVSQGIEGIKMQLLSPKTTSGQRGRVSRMLRQGQSYTSPWRLYTQLDDSQWPPSTDEATAADDIDELKSKLNDIFVQYLDERFKVFSVQPLSLCRVFDTRLWPRGKSDLASF